MSERREARGWLAMGLAAALAACTGELEMIPADGADEDGGMIVPPSDGAPAVAPPIGGDAGARDDGAAPGAADADATDGDPGPSTPTPPPEPPPPPAPECSPATTPCDGETACCGALVCGRTSLGQVCCGNEGESCATPDGSDCCGALLCIDGRCGYDGGAGECAGPCTEAPGLAIEKGRLRTIGGTFLGICGDASHTYGYHVPAARLGSDDYSMQGAANAPVCTWHAAAIDIGMDWPASREWLRWLIQQIREDHIRGIAEVIGSYDGVNVRYWSDGSGWSTDGIRYTGSGHDTHTHVSIYRSTALEDHGILAGWSADRGP